MTLRDDLAAALGPGNHDRIAYAQADSVLQVLADVDERGELVWAVRDARVAAPLGPYPPEQTP